jgi:hypothetical protein
VKTTPALDAWLAASPILLRDGRRVSRMALRSGDCTLIEFLGERKSVAVFDSPEAADCAVAQRRVPWRSQSVPKPARRQARSAAP